MIKYIIFLWIALSVITGLFIALIREREDRAYQQVFLWFISPLAIIAGLVFIDRGRKKRYFKRMRSHLFIKD